MEACSSSSSCRKRGLRPPATATASSHLPVSCLVDRCTADLADCRDYHRRHRVCELHSKSPVVTINARPMRFCQQCSRFQSVVEFDGEKRSCRKRLDGHNRRRRKRQSAIPPIISSPRLLEFGGPGTFSMSNPTTDQWSWITESGSREVTFTTTTTSQDPKLLEVSSRTRNIEKQQFTFTRGFDEDEDDDDRAHSLLSVASRGSLHQTNPEMGLSHVGHPQPEDLKNPSLLFGYGPVTMEINGHGTAKAVHYQLCGESSYIHPVDYN